MSRKYVLAKGNHSKAAGMSQSKVHMGDSVGRLLTQQIPAMSMGDYNNQPGHAPALGNRPGVDTFDSESEQAKAKIEM